MDERSPQAAHTLKIDNRPEWVARLLRPRLIVTVLVVALLALVVGRWLLHRAAHISTSDARIAADMVAVSTDVSGRITALHVAVGERVAAGDLIYEIDARSARYGLAEYQAERDRLLAEIAREEARVGMSTSIADSEIDASRAGTRSAEASIEAARADLDAAQRDFARTRDLFERGLSTQSALDPARNRLESARQALAVALASRDTASAEQRRAVVSGEEVQLIARNIDVLSASIQQVEARIDRQKVLLDQHTIKSPIDGVIDELFYDPGEHSLQGFRMALLHDPDKVWVRANIKETEVRHVQPGAKVLVRVDSAPGANVTGRVALVRELTVAEAALMPNPNATGVFTKITQRIPIRIELDPTDIALRPGTMVSVEIARNDKPVQP